MDQPNDAAVIQNILNEIASVQVFGDISFKPIFDHEHGRYQVIATGWEGERQVLRTVALLEVCHICQVPRSSSGTFVGFQIVSRNKLDVHT